MKKIKLGIVGAGFTSQTCHIPNFFKNKKVFIVALAEKRKLLRHKIAKKYKIKNIYESHKQLLLNEKEIEIIQLDKSIVYNTNIVKELQSKREYLLSESYISEALYNKMISVSPETLIIHINTK